ISFLPYASAYSYDDYYKNTSAAVGTAQGNGVIKLEAESTTNTSTNVVYPIEDRTSPLTSPCDTGRTLLNTIGTSKWATAGQWVEYSFSVDTPGWYDIYARFKQSYLDGMYVSRSLQIFTYDQNFVQYDEASYLAKFKKAAGYYNGLPFAEAAGWRFDYSTDWQVTKLTDGADDYQIYFQKGVIYTIRLEVTLGTMSDQVRKIEGVLELLNSCYLDIIQLTGTAPDDYRDYSFYRMLPKTMENMIVGKNTLKEISDMLRNTAGVASTYTGVCDKLVDLLERMVSDGGSPIAKNLDTFKSYVGSLGTFLTDAKTQPLQLDYLSIQPSTEGAPAASANFFQSLWHEIMSFIQSFLRD
ncbi:MAG: hypothetical protein IJX13_05460, partial [Clostridia bacterium]|nr:hypothetical protein [Clostridia bacterium]